MSNTITTSSKSSSTYSMVYIALFAVLMAVCSQIQIPSVVPFTLQTFSVFLTCGLLGGKRGTASILIYILLGMIGLPVFAGFKGGAAVLAGTTGGYIIGFIFSALIMWAFEKISKRNNIMLVISMILGLIACYIFGTAWFMYLYTQSNGYIALGTVLGWCVIPFIIPDIAKIILAFVLTVRLRKVLPIKN